MGLDIIAYKNLIIDENASYDDGEGDYQVHCYIMDWTDNHIPLRDDVCYKTDEEEFHFKAGSYGGYGQWRDWLCHIIHGIPVRELWDNKEEYQGRAFFELLYFSDCEGTIGPIVSKKLYEDFISYQETINDWFSKQPKDDWQADNNVELYQHWTLAFKMASVNGSVCFL